MPSAFISFLDVDHSVSRSPTSRSFPSTSTSLSHALIQEALSHSSDEGETLSFTKKNLTDIGGAAAEELATIGMESPEDESKVRRIALNHNRLTTIPMEFALLSRLRYLNLKNNGFSVFPDVLTLMTALDTLDISHNKIKRLPSQPGNLVNLKVFCLTRNKLSRLPTYMVQFKRLAILDVDRNPIEWPPKSVMERSASQDGVIGWIKHVQRWIELECSGVENRSHDDSGFSEIENTRIEDSYGTWGGISMTESEFDDGVTPHARSFSIDSNFSVSSIADSVTIDTPGSQYRLSDKPPPLHLGMLRSGSTETSPTHSLESYLPSPAESDTFPDQSSVEDEINQRLQQQHGRNASYAGDSHKSSRTRLFTDKKSMPDLRTAKLNFTKKSAERPPHMFNGKAPFVDEYPSPMSQRQDSGSSFSSTSRQAVKPQTKEYPPQISPTRNVPSMAFERNSYFRRCSTLPTSASNNIPTPLLNLIDTARSILFAVCQIYQVLEYYTLHADERLSSVLKKVLQPASSDMMQFINSLDRFDAMSRKTIPPPSICRGVLESCKNTVAVFGKTIGVLSLQLKVIVNVDDVRYMRSLVLNLYGATAEITLAWQSIIPQLDAIKPLLQSKTFNSPHPANNLGVLIGSPDSFSTSASTSASLDSPTQPLGSLRSHPAIRTHTARRHAGSFSSKDVEIGKTLPSYDIPLPTFPRNISTMSTKSILRSNRKATQLQSSSISSPIPTSVSAESSRVNHSRSGSATSSLQASSTSSSPVFPPPKTTFPEAPSTSKIQVDKEAIQAVQAAVEIASSVWDMVEDYMSGAREDMRESLERARGSTSRLSDMIRALKDGDSSVDKKALREEANIFVKIVVEIVSAFKSYGGSTSNDFRMKMSQLTNATEEFAILLHVSSFSLPHPGPSSSRSYSPMLNVSTLHSGTLGLPEDSKLGPLLTRSRSAQSSASIRPPVSPIPEGSRSATPNQSFKVPVIKRFKDREPRYDGNDPG